MLRKGGAGLPSASGSRPGTCETRRVSEGFAGDSRNPIRRKLHRTKARSPASRGDFLVDSSRRTRRSDDPLGSEKLSKGTPPPRSPQAFACQSSHGSTVRQENAL